MCACVKGFSQAHDAVPDSAAWKDTRVIHIGYGTQDARQSTSSISAVSGSELRETFVPNVANALYGRIPGLMVVQRGNEPGNDSPALYARGLQTFGEAGTAPLIVVDGIESSFEQMSSYEIESISLLKDASATAIFGSRGANGVLLVTTRRGHEGTLKINFSAQLGFQQAIRLPQFLNSYEYATLYNEGAVNDGSVPVYSNDQLEAYRTGSSPYLYPNVNWYDQILRSSAPIANYNLNFTGGDTNVKYFASVNALSNGGLYKTTGDLSDNSINAKYQRYNVRTNVDIRLSNTFSTAVDLGGAVEEKSTPYANTTDGIFGMMSTLPPNAFPVYNEDGSYGGNSLYTNPLGDILESGFYTSSSRTFQSSFKLNADLDRLTPGLSATARLAYHTTFISYSNKSREYERFDISEDNGQIVYTRFGQNTQLAGDEGESDQWQNLTFQTFLNYQRSFGDYALDAMTMYNYKHFTLIGPSEYYPADGSVFPFQHVGVAGRFTNTYKGKYIAELSVAYSGSENFAKDDRMGIFPAASVGWMISDEDFFRRSDTFSFLKLRASYGIVGNDNVGGERFMFDPSYNGSSGYYFGGTNTYVPGIEPGRVANPGFTWEKEEKLNVGIEASILNRFNVTLDYFRQKRYDILVPAYSEVPGFLGLEYPYLNVGEVENQGVEAAINYRSNLEKTFRYSITANVWYAKNEIAYSAESPQVQPYLYRAGRQINQPFLLEAIGFFENAADIESSPTQIFASVQPGDLKYKDQNGDNIIDNADFYPIGNTAVPTLNLGLSSRLSYKGFYLDFMLQGVTGRSVYLAGSYYHAFQNDAKASTMALGRWHAGNTEAATYPRLSASNNENNFQPSTFWQRDGSFIKLRHAELGYDIPRHIVERLRMENVRVFVNGTNVFSIDHLEYSDPETLSGYPAMRTLSLGASIEF